MILAAMFSFFVICQAGIRCSYSKQGYSKQNMAVSKHHKLYQCSCWDTALNSSQHANVLRHLPNSGFVLVSSGRVDHQ